MKQIKDVEVLKKAFYQGLAEYDNEHGRYVLGDDEIMEIIDSLSVEVLEVKPGAIDSLIGLVQATCSEQIDFDTAGAARAELAQLQAENEELKETAKQAVDSNIKLRTEIVHSDKRDIAIKISNQETEIKNLKGALRTLAKWWNPTFGCMYCPCYEKCVPHVLSDEECCREVVAYARANPTEEVEE